MTKMLEFEITVPIWADDLRKWIGLNNTEYGTGRFRRHVIHALETHMQMELDNVPEDIFSGMPEIVKEIMKAEELKRDRTWEKPEPHILKQSAKYKEVLSKLDEWYSKEKFTITKQWNYNRDHYLMVTFNVWAKAGDYETPFAIIRYKFTSSRNVIKVIP